jgi:hypothetical protein
MKEIVFANEQEYNVIEEVGQEKIVDFSTGYSI